MDFALLLLAVQSTNFSSDRFRDLTIREIYAAEHPRPNWETHYFWANSLGDHNHDGQMDFALAGVGLKPNYYGDEIIRIDSGLQSLFSEEYHSLWWSRFHPQQSTVQEGYALATLSSPVGPRIAILNTQAELTLWDLDARAFLGIVPVPPPPVPGLPGANVLTYVIADTDVDADGWTDLFFIDRNAGYAIAGLISGRTLQPIWQHLQSPPAHLTRPIFHLQVADRPDLDGDAVPDFLYGMENWYSTHADYIVHALSGASGVPIWDRTLVTTLGGWATQVPDVTNDGVPDVVMGVGDRVLNSDLVVQGLDGSTGAPIWALTKAETLAHLPPPFAMVVPFAAGWCQPSPSGGSRGPHEVWMHYNVDEGYPWWTHTPRNAFVVLDTASGRVLDTLIQPRELHPWRQYISGGPLYRDIFPLGDVDRDGLIEYAQPVWANDVNDPNIPGDPYHLVIYGQSTLIGPTEAVPGEDLSCELWIPGAPGREAWIAASTVLESEAGLVLDGWRTRLGSSALRTLTVNGKPGRATLDARGRASLTWKLPAWPRLAGEKLFLRAVVEQPGTGEIWTLSSLAVVPVR